MSDTDTTTTDATTEGPTKEAPAPEATPAPAPTKPTGRPAPKATPAPAPTKPAGTPEDGHWWWGTGRRKSAVARVRIRPGSGDFTINGRPYREFFCEERDHHDLDTLLERTRTKGALDVFVNVIGGGYTGQAGAIILGLGRALRKYDPSLESILREHGYLTRDPRQVERQKPGQPGARRRFQFSKR